MSRGGGAPSEPIAVVGAGVKAPGGSSPDELWSSLCAGRSFATVYEDERFPADTRVLVATVDGFDAADYFSPVEMRRLDRTHQIAIAAAADAISAAGGELPARERCAVVCGVGLGATATYEEQHANLAARGLRGLSPLTVPLLMPSSMAAHLSLRFGFAGPCLSVSTACASGATAIGEGVELLRRGAADLVLAGGADSMVSYAALCSFLRLEVMSQHVCAPELASRPFDVDRDGFVMAEGAGFVVLQRAADAVATGRPALGLVAGYGASADAHHLVAPPADGEGALRCMRLALADAGIEAAVVGHVNAHGTGTRRNDLAEATALGHLFGSVTPPVTAVKGTTGHMVAGSGAVEAIVALLSLWHELVPPVAGLRTLDPLIDIDAVMGGPRKVSGEYALSNSFGFGGANASLVLAGAAS